LDQPARNTRARYNVCPTTTIDTIVGSDGKRQLVPMRWGLYRLGGRQGIKDGDVQCPRRNPHLSILN
jgi:putative SOS response-associated peptidase YedK